MSSNVTLVLQSEMDGHPLVGSPFQQVLAAATQVQQFNVQKAVDAVGSYATIPTLDSLASIVMLLLLNPDAQLVYRFQGQSDAGLVVPAGGLVLISGALIDSGAGTNVLVNNSNSNSAATIIGFAATE